MINDNKETKICKRCGRELPLDKFGINNGYIRSFCKDCNNKYHRGYRHAKRMQANIEMYNTDISMQIQRKYKHINSSRILTKAVSGINYIARGEKFVSLFDYKNAWISSYGRIIIRIMKDISC